MCDKINVLFAPSIDEEEKEIFENVFGKDKVIFGEYRMKGMIGGAFDIQIIINILNDPATTALLHGTELVSLIALLVKKLFRRNTKMMMGNGTRPRYTNLTIRMENTWITISNTNSRNKIFISKVSADFKEIEKQLEKKADEYSDEKLKEYIEQNFG